MPLIVLFLLLLAAVFLLDNRIIFRILFVVVNLWLTVMYFVIAEIQTANCRRCPGLTRPAFPARWSFIWRF